MRSIIPFLIVVVCFAIVTIGLLVILSLKAGWWVP